MRRTHTHTHTHTHARVAQFIDAHELLARALELARGEVPPPPPPQSPPHLCLEALEQRVSSLVARRLRVLSAQQNALADAAASRTMTATAFSCNAFAATYCAAPAFGSVVNNA